MMITISVVLFVWVVTVLAFLFRFCFTYIRDGWRAINLSFYFGATLALVLPLILLTIVVALPRGSLPIGDITSARTPLCDFPSPCGISGEYQRVPAIKNTTSDLSIEIYRNDVKLDKLRLSIEAASANLLIVECDVALHDLIKSKTLPTLDDQIVDFLSKRVAGCHSRLRETINRLKEATDDYSQSELNLQSLKKLIPDTRPELMIMPFGRLSDIPS